MKGTRRLILVKLGIAALAVALLGGMGSFVSTAHAAPGRVIPNILPCQSTSWRVIETKSQNFTSGGNTYTVTAQLQGEWDASGFNVFCDVMRAIASVHIPASAAGVSLTSKLVWDSGVVTAGPISTASGGSTGITPSLTAGPHSTGCGEAIAQVKFDTGATVTPNTLNHCP